MQLSKFNKNTLIEQICEYIESKYGLKVTALNVDKLLNWFNKLNYKNNSEIFFELDSHFQSFFLNNESYFFRHPKQLKFLEEIAKNHNNIRILIVGSSFGQGAYSCAIKLKNIGIDYNIIAIDLDQSAINLAKQATFSINQIRISNSEIEKYFLKNENYYSLKEEYKANITFLNLNILDSCNELQNDIFDIVICNNLMIYYTNPFINKISDKLYKVLKPGGILLTTEIELNIKELMQKFIMNSKGRFSYFVKPINILDFEFQELYKKDNHIDEIKDVYNLDEIDFPKKSEEILERGNNFFKEFNYLMAFKFYYKLLEIKFNEKYLLKMIACLENLNILSEAKKWQYTYLLSTIPNEFQIKKYLDLCIKTLDMDEYERVLPKLKSFT